jgi:hypothetical protein
MMRMETGIEMLTVIRRLTKTEMGTGMGMEMGTGMEMEMGMAKQ